MVLPEKAAKSFSTGKTPANTKKTAPNMEVSAKGNLSVTNITAIIASTINEIIACVIFIPP